MQYGEQVKRIGVRRAYRRLLSSKPKTVAMITKLEAIKLLRKELPEKEFVYAVAAIVLDEGGYWDKLAEERLAEALGA
jgi:hypothetical protein